ncbi:hypothetical protein ACO0RG_003407 [Hanseniaspora osmophila]
MSDLEVETATLSAIKTLYPPCCLQILPDNEHILVGTYELQKESGKRIGSIDLYRFDASTNKLSLVYRFSDNVSAILDLKLNGMNKFVTAHSTGELRLWEYIFDGEKTFELKLVQKYQVFQSDVLVTSCHIRNGYGSSENNIPEGNEVLCTGTNGELKLVDLSQYTENNVSESVYEFDSAHSLECWTAEFGKLAPLENCVLSGGDDSVVKLFDTRTRNEVWSNSRIHEAGVVAIKCASPSFRNSRPTSILTGSYDDNIRSFDLRMLSATTIYPGTMPPTNIKSKNLGGGVWRFVENPFYAQDPTVDEILVCCMYNGAKVVKIFDEDEDEQNEESIFKEQNYVKKGHDSMCYGGDWSKSFIATCSFYDNKLQVWRP